MKASLFLSLLILAAGGFLGWRQQDQLAGVREVHRQVTEEARALGLAPDALLEAGKPPLSTKSGREEAEDKTVAAKAFSKELIAFAVKMKEYERTGTQPDEDFQRNIMEVMGRFTELSPAQIKVVIEEMKLSSDLDDEMRSNMTGFAVMMLANNHPQAAVAIYTESPDLVMQNDMGTHVVRSALGKWAEQDPVAAMEWLKKNAEKHAKLVNDDTRATIFEGAAKQDPKLALSLADELGLKDVARMGGAMAGAARTPEERSALLQTLRSEKKDDLAKVALNALGGQLSAEGFESSGAWLSSAKLSESELKAVAEGLSPWQVKADTGKWIEWMDGKVPAATVETKTRELVAQWTQRDFNAAGTWIGTLAEGSTKTAAIKSFATTVAPYEPESAVEWANTLPAGSERDELLKIIEVERRRSVLTQEEIQYTDPDEE
ncbi:hypothetical protein OKA04_10845 [Luteolibacter flavescens]|uniref:HEAT repeat domain-containing protein n=1 Tax=Luteolibacter flavescens TaxID=1859460 RepID=A0ABT3FNS6_9BACT|nr:hypothetical protein [Luteolibacter flavescens]MCW1885226.1 hypothetical protein [Luteolibacter flavescens]